MTVLICPNCHERHAPQTTDDLYCPGDCGVELRPPCGVCSWPADAMVEYTRNLKVPRCLEHSEDTPYRAEIQLALAEDALQSVRNVGDRAAIQAANTYLRKGNL